LDSPKSVMSYHEIPLCVSQLVAMTLYCQVTQISMVAFQYTVDTRGG
jgi:hypothetical protein